MEANPWLAAALGFLTMAYAIYIVEPAFGRWMRLKWNAYWRRKHRERMHRGFSLRSNPYFRDATW